MTDRDIICSLAPLAQQGDPDATDRLCREAYTVVRKMIRRRGLFLAGAEEADMVQEAMRGVLDALKGWDGRSPFFAFMTMCVERQLIEAIKLYGRFKHRPLNYGASLDIPAHFDRGGIVEPRIAWWDLPDPSGLGDDPAALVGEGAEELIEALAEPLTPLEGTYFRRCILAGRSYQTVATALGRSYRSADNGLQRCRRKLLRRAAVLADDPEWPDDTRYLLREAVQLAEVNRSRMGPKIGRRGMAV